MDRYEVMAGKMAPLTDGAHRKWGFAGKVEVVEPCKLLSISSLSLPHKLLVACVYVQFPVPLEHVLDPLAATDNIPCADLPRAQGLTPRAHPHGSK